MKSLVIIPAFNEEKSLLRTVQDLQENAPDFDYIIVNDCSTDHTRQLCAKEGLKVLNLPVNLGIGGAVQTGYQYALKNGYQVTVQFDGDGQHDARHLNEMKQLLIEHELDMVIGSRFIEKEGFQSSGMRRIGIRYFTNLIHLFTGVTITDPTSGMRMAGREVIHMFAEEYPKDYPEPESVVSIIKSGRKVEEYPVVMKEREDGVSSISPVRSVYYMIKVSLAILIELLRRRRI